jgi:hypothetical protein
MVINFILSVCYVFAFGIIFLLCMIDFWLLNTSTREIQTSLLGPAHLSPNLMALAASSPLHAVPPAPALHTPPEKRGGTPSTGCTAGRHSVAHPSRWSGPPPSQHDSTSGDQVLGSQRPAVPAVQHDSDSTSGPRLRAFCCAGSSLCRAHCLCLCRSAVQVTSARSPRLTASAVQVLAFCCPRLRASRRMCIPSFGIPSLLPCWYSKLNVPLWSQKSVLDRVWSKP